MKWGVYELTSKWQAKRLATFATQEEARRWMRELGEARYRQWKQNGGPYPAQLKVLETAYERTLGDVVTA